MPKGPTAVTEENFECRDCGYIHTKEDGRKPAKCVYCGASNFRRVSDSKETNVNKSSSFLANQLEAMTGREVLVYIILGIIFVGSMIGLIILLI